MGLIFRDFQRNVIAASRGAVIELLTGFSSKFRGSSTLRIAI
jgi:hypothetical protein